MLSLFLYSVIFTTNHLVVKHFLKKNKKIKMVIFLSISILSLFAALRYKVGTDWQTYYDYFKYVGVYDFGYMEPIYNAINIIVYKLSHSFSVFCFVIAFLIQYLTYKALYNYNKEIDKIDISLGIYIMTFTLFVGSFNTMRQNLAVAIILYASIYLFKKEYVKYIFFVVLASLTHYSAFICIFFILFRLDFDKVTRKTLKKVYVFVIIFTIFFGKQITYGLFNMVSSLQLYSNYSISEQVLSYDYLIQIIPLIVIILFIGSEKLNKNRYLRMLFKIVLLQFVFQTFGNYIEYADRLALYSSSFQIMLFPIVESNIVNKVRRKKFRIFTYIWFFILFVIIYFIFGGNDIFPYLINFTF